MSKETTLAEKSEVDQIRIEDAGIDTLISNIDFIKSKIPAKSLLTEGEITQRLMGKRFGIKVAFAGNQFLGLTVWHEKNSKEAYLWIGAYSLSGKGIGSEVLKKVIEEIKVEGFEKVSVKVGKENFIAKRHLEKFGFYESAEESETFLMELAVRRGGEKL